MNEKLFTVIYRDPSTQGTVSFPRFAESREALLSTLPQEHPRYAGYVLLNVY